MKYIIDDNTVDYSLSEQEHVIYQASKEKLLVVNQLGAYIWVRLKNQQELDDIAISICADFAQEDESKIKNDILVFVNQLSNHGLISITE